MTKILLCMLRNCAHGFLDFMSFDFVVKQAVVHDLETAVKHTSFTVFIVCRAHGNSKHCRKLFQRILNSVSDWPESISEAYIQFEREEGDTYCILYNLEC